MLLLLINFIIFIIEIKDRTAQEPVVPQPDLAHQMKLNLERSKLAFRQMDQQTNAIS